MEGHRSKYCKFSGGRDLIIQDSDSSLVIQPGRLNTLPSPNSTADEILTEVIEAKLSAFITQEIVYQLYANLFLAVTSTFISKIETGYYKDKTEILQAGNLIGYGMICTISGWFAFYKLSVDLVNQKSTFTTKIEPSARTIIGTALCIHFCVEYVLIKRK